MTKYVHIVQVHPVELGEPNLYKVKAEKEFDSKEEALYWILSFNYQAISQATELEAVYLGRVNDATGEIE